MTRRWTLNERHGYYVATGLRDPVVDLTLRFKRLDSTVEPVGRYRLDLDDLVAANMVTRRPIPGSRDPRQTASTRSGPSGTNSLR